MRHFALLILSAAALIAGESPWPLDVDRPGGVVTVYQPQPERLNGSTLTVRAAVSWLPKGSEESQRVFAAVWLDAVLDIDRDQEVASARSVKITKVLLPNGEAQKQDRDAGARAAVEDAINALGLHLDLDRLAATIEDVETGVVDLSTEAPAILVRSTPAILVPVVGKPVWKTVAGGAERLISTPAFVVKSGNIIWMRVEGDWLVAADLAGPWTFPDRNTPDVVKAAATAEGVSVGSARAGGAAPPEVIIADKAAELILFDGAPEFAKLTPDGALEVAENTEDDVVRETAGGRCYVLCSGRWFAAPSLADGQTWTLVPGDKLPAAFAAIPATGERAHLRAHIAGTDEATEAAALAQVPQTATVPRTATIQVAFDGEPRWVEIAGRNVAWAENSADAVFRVVGPRYYCCRDGVWYEADAVAGPWTVATSKPEALDDLPSSCPWANVNAVEVYDHDTEYVYVGCTPAYYGWYVYGGCPVYGTGWWYGGYYGGHYPVTYGYRVRYNPYSGNWTVGVGVAGPGWAVGGIRVGGAWGSSGIVVGGGGAVVRPGTGVRPSPYDRVQGAKRPQLQAAGDRLRTVRPDGAQAATRPGNLAVDRDGRILRPAADGRLEERGDRTWKQPADRPGTQAKPTERPKPATAQKPAAAPKSKPAPISRPQPERVQQMRSRGETRVQQRASPPPRPASRPAGGGGGGRRR